MFALHRLSALVALIALALTASSADAPSASDILEHLGTTYRECRTYRDTGVVATRFISGSGTRLDEKPFKTAFIRPDRFRFEYTSRFYAKRSRHIIWQRGTVVKSWWTAKAGVQTDTSLANALAAATGVSGGSAHKVPSLLMPEAVGGRQMTRVEDPQLLHEAIDRGVVCYRVTGRYGKQPVTLWIDKRTYLLRRIDQQHQFDDVRTETTITYEPVISEPVPAELLEFNGPSS